MALKRINENPTITDKAIFDIVTPDYQDCFSSNPYKVSKVIIYHAEINTESSNAEEYNEIIYDDTAKANVEAARTTYCMSGSEADLLAFISAQDKLAQSARTTPIYYRGVVPVTIIGTDNTPAWLDPTSIYDADTQKKVRGENRLILIDEDVDGNTQCGHFELHWEPLGMREGDYFICWTWSPVANGETRTAHIHFTLYGNTQLTTSIPSHYTVPDKYDILLERYLPEVFKMSLSDSDLAPQVLHELNAAIAKGFTFLENMANQLVDLQDANSTHEALLPYLSNLFNLKLKSEDPTLWRGQIKRAIPLFKKKGTISALREAMSLAGINLLKLTRMWQVISPYTWQELFNVVDPLINTFTLEKQAIFPIDGNNLELYYRYADPAGTLPNERHEWVRLDSPLDYIQFVDLGDGTTELRWIGSGASAGITLQEGDSFRVVYQVRSVGSQQNVETYIRTKPLDLADQRDERNQSCPKNNWNVRLIEEDDPMFDVIIPTRHPYFSPLIYGNIRTEFPYSENIYNMEEYNGSTRESLNPCDIDCDFVDPCTYCQSSSYIVDLEIENLGDHRIIEAMEILQEFTPFHFQLHAMILSGSVNDFIPPPQEQIEAIMQIGQEDMIIAGEGQMSINRDMILAAQAERTDLTTEDGTAPFPIIDSGNGYYDHIAFFCPSHNLQNIQMNPSPPTGNNLLEILSGNNSGNKYDLLDPDGHYAQISIVTGSTIEQPTNPFTFRLSNLQYPYPGESRTASFTKEFGLLDSTHLDTLLSLNIKTQWDVLHNPSHIRSGSAWSVQLNGSGPFYIVDHMLSDGTIILDGSTPTIAAPVISYVIHNASGTTEYAASTGNWKLTGRTIVCVENDITGMDLRSVMREGNYALYGGTQYPIIGFVSDSLLKFYVSGYSGGDASGNPITVYRRLIDNEIGFFVYQGLTLTTTVDYESYLVIDNGSGGSPVYEDLINNFKENFLIVIGSQYYNIDSIIGTTITLIGPAQSTWKTTATPVSFTIHKYDRKLFSVYRPDKITTPVHTFGEFPIGDLNWQSDKLDRRGKSLIELTTVNSTPMAFWAWAQNMTNDQSGNQITNLVAQKENITYSIQWKESDEHN